MLFLKCCTKWYPNDPRIPTPAADADPIGTMYLSNPVIKENHELA